MKTLFSLRDTARIFGLKESRLRYWAQTGFINPKGRDGGRRAYTFGDLVEIKAAKELLERGIPLQRVRRNLHALRKAIPESSNLLARLRVCSDGDTLVVIDDQATIDPVSGQALLDFEIRDIDQQVAAVLQLPPSPPTDVDRVLDDSEPATGASLPLAATEAYQSAYGWFLRGLALDGDPEREEEAIQAYGKAIKADPGLAAAHTNLGNIYYRRGDHSGALRCYEMASTLDPDQPEVRYNLANIYEDEGDLDVAIAEYRRALKLAPEFADAHFNLALTLEQVGSRRQAVDHWQRYLELDRATGNSPSPWSELAEEHLTKLSAANQSTPVLR